MSKKYGQHFLSSPSILEKIAVAANPLDEPADLIVEIGPGRGALTEHLLKRAKRIVAIEIDPVMVHYLKQRFREEPRFTVLNQDVLKADLGSFGPSIIAGNLPYYITSPVVERTLAAYGRSV